MWLINTTSMRLEQVLKPEDVKYAILSHSWGEGEVSFQEFANLDKAKAKAGYAKIERTCQKARSQGLKYAWVDTCCIDKSSSAELTEAINSMFRWYQLSHVCYAHIADLPAHKDRRSPAPDWLPAGKSYRWFTRGWTLQELIAPKRLEFYDENWEYRGDKSALLAKISQHTGIDARVLKDSGLLSDTPVARKMSWASKRQTTRIEDTAYCLLGIFNVNMPMIYGEGHRAFIRLQEAIAQETNDLSLFAWTEQKPTAGGFRGLLAKSPAEFSQCGGIMRHRNYLDPNPRFTVTNNGVKMKPVIKESPLGQTVSLECAIKATKSTRYQWIGIYIYKTAFGFVRARPGNWFVTNDDQAWVGERQTVYIHKFLHAEECQRISLELADRMYIKYDAAEQYDIFSSFSSPKELWNCHEGYFLTMESASSTATEQPDIYPPFTGLQGLQIRYRESHLCNGLLVCGLFEDSRGRCRPLAVLYVDSDPKTETIFHAISVTRGGERNAALVRWMRRLVIDQHSPSGGRALSWDDVRDRVVQVKTGSAVRAVITLKLDEGRGGTQGRGDDPNGLKVGDKVYTISIRVRPK